MTDEPRRRPEGSAIDRIVHVADVSWGPAASHRYWVMWTQDGVRQVITFLTPFGARRFASALDPLGRQPTLREIRAAEKALRDLEDEMKEEERAELRALGVPIMTSQERRRTARQLERFGDVGVRRHVRRKVARAKV